MSYKKIIEEDYLDQIMEQNINYLDRIAEQMQLGYVSVFAGAGLSVASGYVDWKRLLSPISKQLRLSNNTDLTEIAQYYKNQFGRQGLNSAIFDEFAKVPKNNDNAAWLAKMPITEYWTTNYDNVIEQEVEKQGKIVETIINQESFKYHNPKREVVVYKMHGDKNFPDDVVLTKEDYQNYDKNREVFTKLLSVELIRKTFLFIGFSFNDPNMERILSIVKNSLNNKAPQTHYCFMRKVQIIDYLDEKNKLDTNAVKRYIQDKNYQELRIRDMSNYGIFPILVDDYNQITLMLQYLYNKYITNNVFVSGGINPTNLSDYGEFNSREVNDSCMSRAELFLTSLGKSLIDNDFQIYTGFGAGVGNYILSGVLKSEKNNILNTEIVNNEIHIRNLMELKNDLKFKIRERMIEKCSSMIILFGYAEDVKKSGTYCEYMLAEKLKRFIIPVKKTGFVAEKIFDELQKEKKLNGNLLFLQEELDIEELVSSIIQALKEYKNEKEILLRKQLFSSVAFLGIRIFISYHYDSDNEIAKEITKIINEDKTNIFTVVEENEKQKDPEIIKSWVDEEIKNTKFTILLLSKETLDRLYVSYELKRSIVNGNTIIPILIDNKENNFTDDNIELIKKSLCDELSMKNDELRMKRWVRDDGRSNILKWLMEELWE